MPNNIDTRNLDATAGAVFLLSDAAPKVVDRRTTSALLASPST